MTTYLDKLLGGTGKNAFTTLSSPFTQPAVSSTVLATVADTSWMVVGQAVFAAAGGAYTVASIVDGTHVNLTNTGASGNATVGATVPANGQIAPAGLPGANGANGTGRNPVRAVQTATLPAYTYNSGTKTITMSANGALSSAYFDGIAPNSTDTFRDFLIVYGPAGQIAHSDTGVYTCTQTGDASHPAIFTRRSDTNTSAGFIGGVQLDVIDGNGSLTSQKGRRWYLTTATAVTLDTTALTWAPQIRDLFVDLTQPRYNCKPGVSDIAPGLTLFESDVRASTLYASHIRLVGVLPAAVLYCSLARLGKYGSTGLLGQGESNTIIRPVVGQNAGATLIMGDRKPPTLYGGTVDTGAGAPNTPTPIYMYDEVAPGSGFDPYFDFTRDCAVQFYTTAANTQDVGWDQYAFAFNFRQMALPNAGAGTTNNLHYYSCRGSQCSGFPLNSMFFLNTNANGDGGIALSVRLTDVTTGVYGSITQLQALPLVVTANYTQPAASSTVSVTCVSTSGLSGGQTVYVIGGGYYTVSSVTDSTHVVLTNTGATGNATATSTVTAGTTTGANFTQPAENGLVNVQVASSTPFKIGALAYVVGGGFYAVTALIDSTHVQLRNRADTDARADVGNAAPGTVINSGAVVSVALLSVVGTSVVTGDSTITPTEDHACVMVRVVQGGTVGTAGITYQTSIDGISWREATPQALGTATSITIQDPLANGLRFKAKINLAAGTLLSHTVIAFSTSGVDTTYSLSLPAATLTAGQNHEIYWGFDGTNIQLYAGQFGGSWAHTSVAAHGKLLQKPGERFVMGCPVNAGAVADVSDFKSGLFVLGTLKIQKGVGVFSAPVGNVPTHIAEGGTGQVLYFQPGTNTHAAPVVQQTFYDADGTTPIGWLACNTGNSADVSGYATIVPSRPQNFGVTIFGNSIEGITFDGGPVANQLSCGPLVHSSVYGKFKNWGCLNGGAGARFTGPCFYNEMGSYTARYCKADWGLSVESYELHGSGEWKFDGCRMGLGTGTSSIRTEHPIKLQLEDASRIGISIGYSESCDFGVSSDDENIANSVSPLAHVLIYVIFPSRIRGNIGTGLQVPGVYCVITGPLTVDAVMGGNVGVYMSDPNTPPGLITAGKLYSGATLCNIPGKARPIDGMLPSGTLPNTTSQTLTRRDGGHIMPASTPSGNITLTLADNGEPEGTPWPITIDPQTGATVNVGGLYTVPAGTAWSGMLVHAHPNVGGWIRRAVG